MGGLYVENAVVFGVLGDRELVEGKVRFAVLVVFVAKYLIVNLIEDLITLVIGLADLFIILLSVVEDTFDNVVAGLSVLISNGLSIFHGGIPTGQTDISFLSIVQNVSERALT